MAVTEQNQDTRTYLVSWCLCGDITILTFLAAWRLNAAALAK